jgi:hypothetical protein
VTGDGSPPAPVTAVVHIFTVVGQALFEEQALQSWWITG